MNTAFASNESVHPGGVHLMFWYPDWMGGSCRCYADTYAIMVGQKTLVYFVNVEVGTTQTFNVNWLGNNVQAQVTINNSAGMPNVLQPKYIDCVPKEPGPLNFYCVT